MAGLHVLHNDVGWVPVWSDDLDLLYAKLFEQIACEVIKHDSYGNEIRFPYVVFFQGVAILSLYRSCVSPFTYQVARLAVHLCLSQQLKVELLSGGAYEVTVGKVTSHEVPTAGSAQIHSFHYVDGWKINPHPIVLVMV